MSLSYVDHQRTRFWRTHEEIFDFRKNRDKNWLELHASQEERAEDRRGVRETRRVKWETERKEREKADLEYRQKREDERLDRASQRKTAEASERFAVDDSRRSRQWGGHVAARARFRDAQASRLEEEKKDSNRELESFRRHRDDLAARQLLRQDKVLREESMKVEEVARKKKVDEGHKRNEDDG